MSGHHKINHVSLTSKRNLKERTATIKLLVLLNREDLFNSTCFHPQALTSAFYLPQKRSFQPGDPELRCYKSRTQTFPERSFPRDSPARRLIWKKKNHHQENIMVLKLYFLGLNHCLQIPFTYLKQQVFQQTQYILILVR